MSLSTRLLLLLADVTVRATVLLALTAAVATLSRRASASFRHLVWALGLGGALILPLLVRNLPAWHVPVTVPPTHTRPTALPPSPALTLPPVKEVAAPTHSPARLNTPAAAALPIPSAAPPSPTPMKPQRPESAAPSPVAPHPPVPSVPWPVLALLVWGAGAMLVLAQLAQGLTGLRRITRATVPVSDGPGADAVKAAANALGLRRPVALCQATGAHPVMVPLTYGALRPVIVLPAGAPEWPPERLRAALLHEMAHVRRRDWLFQVMGHVAHALYWFHPLVWLAVRRLRAEAETASDDLVLLAGVPAQDYARHLLDVALSTRQGRPSAGAVAMAQEPKIEARLRLILTLGRSRREVTGGVQAAVMVIAVCLFVVGSVVRLTSRASGIADALPSASAHIRVARAANPVVALPNGATIRLLGVTDTQAVGPTPWWAANGTGVKQTLPENTLRFPNLHSGVEGRAFAVETTYTPQAQPHYAWNTQADSRWAFVRQAGGRRRYYLKPNFTLEFVPDEHIKFLDHGQIQGHARGSQISWLTISTLAARATQRTVTLRYAVAAGPWTLKVDCPKKAGKTYIRTPSGNVIFTLIPNPHHLPAMQAARGNAAVMVSDYFRTPSPVRPTASPDGALRDALRGGENYDRVVLALDHAGHIVTQVSYSELTSPDPQAGVDQVKTMQSAWISNQLLRRVTSFRLLARPFRWAEFRDIPLAPLPASATARRSAQATGGDSAAIHLALGEKLQRQGQPRDGIPEFRRAVQLDPKNAEAQFQLAQALYESTWKHFRSRQRDSFVSRPVPPAVMDEAIRHMETTVVLRPEEAEWHSALGAYLAARHRYGEAANQFRITLHLLPPIRPVNLEKGVPSSLSQTAQNTFDGHWSLADALLKLRHYQEAAVQFQEALRFMPTEDWVWLGYGDALHGLGRRAEARVAWHKCLAAQPPNPYYQRQARTRLAQY